MDQYDFQHLKTAHATQYAHMLSEWNRTPPPSDARLKRAWARIGESNKRVEECAKDMGMSFLELCALDMEVDATKRAKRQELKRHLETPEKPGCISFYDNCKYLRGGTTPQESKKFYEHYSKCNTCLKEIFIYEIAVSL